MNLARAVADSADLCKTTCADLRAEIYEHYGMYTGTSRTSD